MQKKRKKTASGTKAGMVAAFMATLLAVSCTDSYPTLIHNDGSQIGNDETYDRTPIMMFVNEQNYFSITATRGTGVFDEEHDSKYAAAVIHVFAFRDGFDQQGLLSSPADLRRTMFDETHSFFDSGQADCLLDGPDYNVGMPTRFSADRTGALEPQTERGLYYSATYQDVGYNFFAYHIDDFAPTSANTHRDAERIWYDIEIDGSQDILSGYAPKLTREVLDEKIGASGLGISEDDQNRILNIGNYSTFAAHRGVNPVMDLRHRLARMKFEAYPGDESADNITITGITVESRYRGEFTVASRSTDDIGRIVFSGERKPLELREASPDGAQPCPPLSEDGYVVHYDPSMAGSNWEDRPALKIGESLMLAPDSTYTLTLYYTQTIDVGNGHTEVKQLSSRYAVKAQRNSYYRDTATGEYIFLPGYLYTVKIVVYGLQDIRVSVNIEGWKDGGDVPLDPDQSYDSVID